MLCRCRLAAGAGRAEARSKRP